MLVFFVSCKLSNDAYIRTHIHTYNIHTHKQTYVCIYNYIDTYIRIHTHKQTYVCIYIDSCILIINNIHNGICCTYKACDPYTIYITHTHNIVINT